MRNAMAAQIKRTAVEKQVNVHIIFLFGFLLALSIRSTIGASINMWYLFHSNTFSGRALINSGLDLYYGTSSLVEELGQIEFIFSDKTGTLSRNEVEFSVSIGRVVYAKEVDESLKAGAERDEEGVKESWRTFDDLRHAPKNPISAEAMVMSDGVLKEREVAHQFMVLLAFFHTVVPEVRDGKTHFQASCLDEAALMAGAELLWTNGRVRDLERVRIQFDAKAHVDGRARTGRQDQAVLQTVILGRLGKHQLFTEKMLSCLQWMGLCYQRSLHALHRLPRHPPSRIHPMGIHLYQGHNKVLDQAAELIEKDMFLLGATVIEDKPQEGVPDTIHTLQGAGIKIWVLTGDRQEMAINIGVSCRLVGESMNLVVANEETARETAEFIEKRLSAIGNQSISGEVGDSALVIGGKSLMFALEKEVFKSFLELALFSKAIICCRVSPLQKALVVKLVKKNQNSILLVIGYGANDVSMIQAAHIGVGISGVEVGVVVGLQAARSADIAISQFRYLKKLLLVYGAWSYQLILYSFYKSMTLYMTQLWVPSVLSAFHFRRRAAHYSFFNNFSGQISYESWTISFYNVIFTVLPPLVIGIFDQFVSARVMDRYPQLYAPGKKNVFSPRRRVRVVQRVKRNAGFAFSQTEGCCGRCRSGVVLDQTGVIGVWWYGWGEADGGIDSDCIPSFSFFVDTDVLILRERWHPVRVDRLQRASWGAFGTLPYIDQSAGSVTDLHDTGVSFLAESRAVCARLIKVLTLCRYPVENGYRFDEIWQGLRVISLRMSVPPWWVTVVNALRARWRELSFSTRGRIFAKRPVENGDDATPDDLISGMRGEEVVDALVDVVKGIVDLLEPAPLGEVCCTGQHGDRGVRSEDVPGILRWLHITLTTSSQSSDDSSSRLLNDRGWSAGGSAGGGAGDAGTSAGTDTVLVLFFFAVCFARGPGHGDGVS
ncbi:hypothetical protein HD554DRAFT_2042818 [Boletus coccyginus]|nr:hypothetical protein HD554DRAFT_2042818 [Boletus coccyginus]